MGLDQQALRSQLAIYTRNQFHTSFGYQALGTSSNPPGSIDSTKVRGISQFFACPAQKPTLISNNIGLIFPQTSLPSYLYMVASSDLAQEIVIFLQNASLGWMSTQYHRSYVDNSSTGVIWNVDMQFVWTCVQATDWSASNPQSQMVLFMNFVGTTYPVNG